MPLGPVATAEVSANFAAASQTLATAVLQSTTDPADAIRLLVPLAGFMPPPLPGSGALQQQATDALNALASNLRCSACSALGVAAQNYQPVSYQDALAVRKLVCDTLDAEATRAGDAFLDATYQALRDLRAAVALDLAVRGANLAALVEVTTVVSMPSLVEAWTLYQDTSREPGLVASADAPHPLFMPTSFPALSR